MGKLRGDSSPLFCKMDSWCKKVLILVIWPEFCCHWRPCRGFCLRLALSPYSVHSATCVDAPLARFSSGYRCVYSHQPLRHSEAMALADCTGCSVGPVQMFRCA